MAKIGHNAWAIAFAKCSVWVQNQNSTKHVKNDSKSTLELFCGKKRLEKRPHIRQMTTFRKWPKLVTMHGL